MVLPDGGRVDFARLREQRRARVLAATEDHDLDVLLLGREPNAEYVAGVRRLHLGGTRPWAPGCVVVRSGARVHVMSVWDDGIPAEISHEQLYGITWNPLNFDRLPSQDRRGWRRLRRVGSGRDVAAVPAARPDGGPRRPDRERRADAAPRSRRL